MEIGVGSYLSCGLDAFPEPYMIKMGKNIDIADEVQFLTHDGAFPWLTVKMGLAEKPSEKMGQIIVGDNCFVGWRAIIMQNVKIGNNCIIGAGAVVTKDVPNGSVVAGCPAKVICSIEEYIEKNKDNCDYTIGWSIYDKRKYFEEKLKSGLI